MQCWVNVHVKRHQIILKASDIELIGVSFLQNGDLFFGEILGKTGKFTAVHEVKNKEFKNHRSDFLFYSVTTECNTVSNSLFRLKCCSLGLLSNNSNSRLSRNWPKFDNFCSRACIVSALDCLQKTILEYILQNLVQRVSKSIDFRKKKIRYSFSKAKHWISFQKRLHRNYSRLGFMW